MPWYKSGSVSVTQNSNAVIGTGTAFLANSRVGDAFRGPDGAWYEVINIASDTAMAIAPPYQGAASAAGAYALAPMQGYVKDSADALRALVNTYGEKLAALGTTGNYDMLPISKGGTGADTVEDARTALGLIPQTSPSDATPGSLLEVGAFGLGANALSASESQLNAANRPTSFLYVTAESLGLLPSNGNHYVLHVDNLEANYALQIAWTTGGDKAYVRALSNGNWSGWTGSAKAGANSDITSLTGLTTALSPGQGGTGATSIAGLLTALVGAGAYARSNAVGAVSQAGGVPTGAIMEFVTNANGTAIKFLDGTMICLCSAAFPSVPVNSGSGAIFISTGLAKSTWPLAFVSAPKVTYSSYSSSGVGYCARGDNGTATLTPLLYAVEYVSATRSIGIDYVGIGRWF